MIDYITIDEVCRIVPGTTRGYWAQLRWSGKGPKFFKPSPKVVLYRESDVLEFIAKSELTKTKPRSAA